MIMASKTEKKSYTPTELANELGVDPKRVRAFLRQEFTRDPEAKNTSWNLSDEVAQAVRTRFTKVETESDES
jgi:predicted transcriptional regulator